MPALGPLHIAGLIAAAALLAAAFWLFWAARARADDHRRVVLPLLGRVGNPTCLTLALSSFIASYHATAYSLAPVVPITAIPIDKWWAVAIALVLAVGGALAADALERRDPL